MRQPRSVHYSVTGPDPSAPGQDIPTGRAHAVVLGAGMGGLLAARVLADHYDRVTVVDRDVLFPSSGPRRGVPQGRHAHALVCRGLQGLERLFPGVRDELVDSGAVVVRSDQTAWHGPAGWHATVADDTFTALSLTRPLLEATTAARVRALPNVVFRDGSTVTGLSWTGPAVDGVGLRSADNRESELRADLVVDARGRGSRATASFPAHGYDEPEETVVDPRVGYASRLVTAPEDALGGVRTVVVLAPISTTRRAAIVTRVEGGRWMVSLAGAGPTPPRDDVGFLEFADALPDQAVSELLRGSTEHTDAVTFHGTASRWRHFERVRRHPPGYLAFSDAFCTVNPTYAQGMTLAVLQAEHLARVLARGVAPHELPALAYAAFARVVGPAWAVTTTGDLGHPTTTGIRTRRVRRKLAYLTAVNRAAVTSTVVRRQLLNVTQMLKPPHALLAPHILGLTAVHSLRARSCSPVGPRQLSPRPVADPGAALPA